MAKKEWTEEAKKEWIEKGNGLFEKFSKLVMELGEHLKGIDQFDLSADEEAFMVAWMVVKTKRMEKEIDAL